MAIRYSLLILAWAVCCGATTANAQNPLEGVFQAVGELLGKPEPAVQPPRPVAVQRARVVQRNAAVNDNVKVGFVNMYTPFLQKVLTAELHFVKKVCQPSDEEFAEIHRAGLLSLAVTSKHYEELQKIRQSANQWPDPRDRICAALSEQIDKVLSAEVAERYRQEIAARSEAHREAETGMMLVHIDAELLLNPVQHDEIAKTLKEKWNSSWSSGPRLFVYPQYARLPESHVLRPHLSELQGKLWSQRTNNSSVNFGWQMELGLQDWFGGAVDLEPFAAPKANPPQAANGAETDGAAIIDDAQQLKT